jgi:hypothetical protein
MTPCRKGCKEGEKTKTVSPFAALYQTGSDHPAGEKRRSSMLASEGDLPQLPKLFTYMPLKKMVVTHMPQKSFQAPVCHDLNFDLPVCHSVHHLLRFNGYIDLTSA